MLLGNFVHAKRSALVMWDIQRGVAPRAQNFETLRMGLHATLAAARASNVAVVWSRHVAPPLQFLSAPMVQALMTAQGVAKPQDLELPYQVGSEGTKFVDGFEPAVGELVVDKTTASLFVGTAVDQQLRTAGVTTLVLAGVATELGVEFTARHAAALGYFVVVVEDAVGSFSEAGHRLGMEYLTKAATVAPLADIRDAWVARA
jgi:nicotinamidase-related amidase